jgi:hypothetical protein
VVVALVVALVVGPRRHRQAKLLADTRPLVPVGHHEGVDERAPGVPVWAAATADVAVLVLFVLIGRRTHHEDAGTVGFFRVLWPFLVGLVAGWLLTGLYRAPLDLRRAAGAWITTVAVGMVLRIAVQGHAFKVTFVVVALVFLGVCLLGWRAAVAAWARRADRRSVG